MRCLDIPRSLWYIIDTLDNKGRLRLVTRNEDDFTHSSVTAVNPWTQ